MRELMAHFSLALLAFIFLVATRATSAYDGSITLLQFNDLDVHSTAPPHQSILLLDNGTFADSQSACASLNEALLPSTSSVFSGDIVHLLQFQVFQGKALQGQRFFIASQSSTCQTIDTLGKISPASCSSVLPAICSNSGTTTTATAPVKLTVQSSNLQITGFRDRRSFRFHSIPYANPPQRWTYPTAFTGPSAIDATTFKPSCIQRGNTATSENCLFLNVFTPFLPGKNQQARSALKPVIFWIHGGAFTGGSSVDSTFDGGNMVARSDVVFVNMNYRLSTLGFLALNDGKTNGNFGIADIIAALDWTRAHIADFGGDPNHITVAGQSAGAAAVRALLGSPKAIGKFAGAIEMSNLAGINFAATYSNYFTIATEVTRFANPIIQSVGCSGQADVLACLRRVDANTLVNLPTVASFIVNDGTFVVVEELPLQAGAKVANVHHMIGWMRDDGAAFIGTPTSSNAAAALQAAGLPTTILNSPLFPIPTNGANAIENLFNLTARATTDSQFRCLDQATAFSGVKNNLFQSVWAYEFNRSYQTPGFDPNAPRCDAPVDAAHPNGNPDQEYFKCHSGELFYVFGTLPPSLPFRDANDLPFMQRSMDTFSAFIRTFNPNPDPNFLTARGFTGSVAQFAAQPKWEPVTAANLNGSPLRIFETPADRMSVFRELSQCDFFGFSLNHFG